MHTCVEFYFEQYLNSVLMFVLKYNSKKLLFNLKYVQGEIVSSWVLEKILCHVYHEALLPYYYNHDQKAVL